MTILFYSTASAQAAPDISPVSCTWGKLPVVEQTRLIDEFKVEVLDGSFTLHFAAANAATAAAAATACQLSASPAQAESLALALSRHAATEKAKKGIADKGESPAAIQTALEKMHEGKREVIGDALACPGPHPMVKEWDESVKGAVRRANLRFKDGRAYAWVSLGLYAFFAEEGAVRRMNGTNTDPC
ncbi:MAG: hypothetical protein K8S25_17835 [Alphaproteobacteria bacterium]|nr:hypothetical protein [Alphaproteobacteria bacterium]